MMRSLSIAVMIVILFGSALHAFRSAVDLPQVRKSSLTKQCVRVDDAHAVAEGRKPATCDNLPERYETIWVQ